MRTLPIVVVLVATTAPALAGNAAEPQGADANEALRGDVLVWDDAKLLLDPDDAGSAVQLATLTGTRKDHLGAAFAMKVVGTKGELVEVEPEPTKGCVDGTLRADELVRPHLFVARADLAPVLARPFHATFADGSSVDLRPGIAVAQVNATDVVVRLELRELVLKLPATSIAYSYPAAKIQPQAAFRTGAKITATAEGTPVALAGTIWSGARLRLETEHATKKADRMLLELPDRCGTLVVSAPADQIKTFVQPEFGSGIAPTMGHAPVLDHFKKGTPVATASGHRVGTTSSEVNATLSADGKLGCADFSLDLDANPERHPKSRRAAVKLCAPAKAVVHSGPQPGVMLTSPPKY